MSNKLELETELRKPPPVQADTLGRSVNRWAWDGLCAAWPYLEAGRAGWREVISGQQPSAVVGTLTGGRDNWGQVILSSPGGGGDNYIDYADQPAHRRPSSALTVYTRFRYNGSADFTRGIVGKVHADEVTASWAIYADNTSCNVNTLIRTTSGQSISDAAGALPTNTYTNIFLRWTTGGLLTVDLLKDGGAIAATAGATSSVVTGTLVYAAEPLRLFGTDSHTGVGGDMSVTMVYARRLSDIECRALAHDPFLPFRRSTRSPTELGIGESGMQFIGPTRS